MAEGQSRLRGASPFFPALSARPARVLLIGGGPGGYIRRDLNPAGVMQSMLYLHAMASPLTAALLARLASMGFLTGMGYPVAVRLLAERGKGGSGEAGRLYALDLAGALAAALFGPVLLTPALGMMHSLFLVVALKAAATLLIAAGREISRRLEMDTLQGLA